MDAQKILLVGDPRICPQVAYVMDWKDYEMVDQLTNAKPYRDYKIVVCAFKKQRKQLVKVKDKTLKIYYLNHLCRELDKDYSLTEQITAIKPKTAGKRLLKRVIMSRGISCWLNSWRRHFSFTNYRLLRKLPASLLKTSELMLRVIWSVPTGIVCKGMDWVLRVETDGTVGGCTNAVAPFFGNVLADNFSMDSYRVRIIKLSTLNKSYSLCKLGHCATAIYTDNIPADFKLASPQPAPKELVLALDPSCNLACPSCRKEIYQANHDVYTQHQAIMAKLHQTGCLSKVEILTLAPLGEVFYSDFYREYVSTAHGYKKLFVISNGTLFNRQRWETIKDKYEQIEVMISVDAATAATYRHLRGGNYDNLLANLAMLSNLRQTDQIKFLRIAFVVQRDNYQEMPAFVELGKRLHVDEITFSKLNNWGTFTKREYQQKSMILPNGALARELYDLLQQPLFHDPQIDLRAFTLYLANSAKRYGE